MLLILTSYLPRMLRPFSSISLLWQQHADSDEHLAPVGCITAGQGAHVLL